MASLQNRTHKQTALIDPMLFVHPARLAAKIPTAVQGRVEVASNLLSQFALGISYFPLLLF